MIGLIGHLGSGAVTACTTHRTRRERQTELHAELRRNPLLPQVWLFAAISAIRCCTSAGIRGRPLWTRLQAPEETKKISVPPHEGVGRTIVSSRHSTARERSTNAMRDALSVRRGRTRRSM